MHEVAHRHSIGLGGQIPGRIYADQKAIASKVLALGHHLMMDLNDDETIDWQSQDANPGRIVADFAAIASGFRDPGRSSTDRT